MSDTMKLRPCHVPDGLILRELEASQPIIGVHHSSINIPKPDQPYLAKMSSHPLATPTGQANSLGQDSRSACPSAAYVIKPGTVTSGQYRGRR